LHSGIWGENLGSKQGQGCFLEKKKTGVLRARAQAGRTICILISNC